MNESGRKFLWMIVVPITLALASSGCATKKYARQQAGIVNQRVSKLETKTNQQISYLNAQLKTETAEQSTIIPLPTPRNVEAIFSAKCFPPWR